MTDSQLLYNVKETAEIMGESRWTIQKMLKAKELPYIPWRGSRKAKRIARESIIEYIRKHQIGDPAQMLKAFDQRRRESKSRRTA